MFESLVGPETLSPLLLGSPAEGDPAAYNEHLIGTAFTSAAPADGPKLITTMLQEPRELQAEKPLDNSGKSLGCPETVLSIFQGT
eukprot:9127252-Pyramimonas_sp.AAC.1